MGYSKVSKNNSIIHLYEFNPKEERFSVELGVLNKLEKIDKLAKPKTNEEVTCVINWNVFDWVKSFDGYGEIEQDGIQYKPAHKAFHSISFKDNKLVFGDLPKAQVGVGIAITLIIDGKINIINAAKMATGRDCRTAIGQKRSGNILFLVAENMTTLEVAEYLLSLDCINAFQGDSGGSSSMIVNESYVFNQNRAIAAGLVVYKKKVKASQIIDWCKKQVGTGYVYGGIDVICTIELLKAKQQQYGTLMGEGYYQLNGDYTKGKCAKWLNKRVFDCSGLIKSARKHLGSIYKDVSAQGMYDQCTKRGVIKTMPLIPGCTLYMYSATKARMTHIGMYIGNGLVVECRGVAYGTVITKLSDRAWGFWGLLDWLTYDIKEEKGKVIIGTDSDSGDATTPKTDDKVKIQKVVIADSLNVRSAPNVLSKVLGKLSKNTIVEINKITLGFAEISYKGIKAYVSDKFLVVKK
jgi:cell wall-associated NlpC family hydrolase